MLHIEPLDHRDPAVAARIHAILVLAHAREAEVLQLEPGAAPQRSAADLQSGDEFYLGAHRDHELVGALCLARDDEPEQIQVATLVVHPAHQRLGIGRALLVEALRRGPGMAFSVSTTARNAPALALYRELGFVEYRYGAIGPEALHLVKLRRVSTP